MPLEELGGLTWPTINDRPISHGAIGEEGSAISAGGNKYELSTVPQETTANGVEMGRYIIALDCTMFVFCRSYQIIAIAGKMLFDRPSCLTIFGKSYGIGKYALELFLPFF